MVDNRQNLTEQVANEVRAHFDAQVYETTMPRNVRLSEAPSFGKPIMLYDIASKGAKSYLDLAREFLVASRRASAPSASRPGEAARDERAEAQGAGPRAGGADPRCTARRACPPLAATPAAWTAARRPADRGDRGDSSLARQPRKMFDEARLEELAASIKAQGIIQPLVVRARDGGGGYELIAGERRWRAAQRAGLHEVPAVVRDVAPTHAFEMAMVENLQREDLNPIEEAAGYQRLIDELGYTQE